MSEAYTIAASLGQAKTTALKGSGESRRSLVGSTEHPFKILLYRVIKSNTLTEQSDRDSSQMKILYYCSFISFYKKYCVRKTGKQVGRQKKWIVKTWRLFLLSTSS